MLKSLVTLTAFSVITALSGCASLPSAGTISQSEINSLISGLNCDEVIELKSDLFSDDDMYGFDCRFNERETVMFRQYKSENSVGKVIEDWIPLISDTNKLVWNTKWFAIGNPKDLVAFDVYKSQESNTKIPDVIVKNKSDSWMQDCGAYVVTATISELEKNPNASKLLSDYEKMVPGLSEWISSSSVLKGPEMQKAINVGDYSKVVSILSNDSSGLKSLCESQKDYWK